MVISISHSAAVSALLLDNTDVLDFLPGRPGVQLALDFTLVAFTLFRGILTNRMYLSEQHFGSNAKFLTSSSNYTK